MRINNLDKVLVALVISTLSSAGIGAAAEGQREPWGAQ